MTKPRAFFANLAILSTLALSLTGCYFEAESTDLEAYQRENPNYAHEPQIQMLFNDFRGLTTDTIRTNAIPLKIVVTSMLMKRHEQKGEPLKREHFNEILEEYGFVNPTKIENLKAGVPQPKFEYPMGMVRGDLKIPIMPKLKLKIEVGNLSCFSCHASRTFDSNGFTTNNVWLGAASSSINLQGYTDEVYESLKFIRSRRDELQKTLEVVYPNISQGEKNSIKYFFFDETVKQIDKIASKQDRLLAYHNGPPGTSNGIGSYKSIFGIYDPGDYDPKANGFVSVPDIGYRAFRRNLLVDGIFSLPGEVSLTPIAEDEATLERARKLGTVAATFPTPVMGVKVKNTEATIERMQRYFGEFIYEYKSPKFPGVIDTAMATKGEQIFRSRCTGCHGEYTRGIESPRLVLYPNKFVPAEVIGTDTTRLQVIDKKFLEKMNDTWTVQKLNVEIRKGYMAPILSGVWSTAPYLHNGSVPSLWALMNPEERPATFYVGGHALDFEKVGIIYPEGMRPRSKPVLIDTTVAESGLSNKGHEFPFKGLSKDDKKSLIEYLKLL